MNAKRLLYFLSIFFVGSLTSSLFEWLQPITTIEITNASPKVIKWLDIEYHGMGDYKGRVTTDMTPGKTVTFKGTTDGEAGYRLYVTFDDDTKVVGGMGYTSRGDTVIEVVSAEQIMSKTASMLSGWLIQYAAIDTTYREEKEPKQRKNSAGR